MSPRDQARSPLLSSDPLWYRDAILYEIHIRAFHDSNGDGIGDIPGLIEKLDYLQDLGISAIWILPFYPSPLRDGGYDISDYTTVNPCYGTLRDFKRLLKEAHARGIRVITELVINHTSSEHPWFQKARRSPPGSAAREFYVWSDDPQKYGETRIIFQDFETSNWSWDPVAQAYYWHRFYSHQPDLNFDNPAVRKTVLKLLQFWMDMGVDGLRLDAIPYLYEREGTNCENLPETHVFLKELRATIDARYGDRMLLAEANQWPEDAVAYFGDNEGPECHMNFHFPLMPRMFMALQQESSFPILDILAQTPALPDNAQWALFLRNHDELTLEMVTDEDRDYMYRVYTEDPRARINLGIRRRLSPLVKDRRTVELLNGLLFSLPGTPVLYYGDEIGMGDNIYLGDRDGVRTPMQWSGDRNAGFSRANPQKLFLPVITDPEYHYEATNVEAHQANPRSLLWWMKRLIAVRKQHPVFGRGTIDFLHPENGKILAFVRTHGDERVLVVANLSRFVQCTDLDLSSHEGFTPVELFGQTEFPVIRDKPYFLSLDPHAFLWLALEPKAAPVGEVDRDIPELEVDGRWSELVTTRSTRRLEKILPGWIQGQRWFRGKARRIKTAHVFDAVSFPVKEEAAWILLVDLDYTEGTPERYVVPVLVSLDGARKDIEEKSPRAAIALVTETVGTGKQTRTRTGLLHDAMASVRFSSALLDSFRKKRSVAGKASKILIQPFAPLRRALEREGPFEPRPQTREQSNTSILYGDRFIMKLVRLVEAGPHPEVEMGRRLVEKGGFRHAPTTLGTMEVECKSALPATIGVMQELVDNEGDGWTMTLDVLGRTFEEARARAGQATPENTDGDLLQASRSEPPSGMAELIGPYLGRARLLGQRTGEMHLALSNEKEDPAFIPEPFTTLHQRSLYQSARNQLRQGFQALQKRLSGGGLDEDTTDLARRVLGAEAQADSRLKKIAGKKIETVRIRCHGDYHLGQVLSTGKDFVILDFEGEPGRALAERRFKRSPFRDVTGMLRSFHYASVAALRGEAFRPEDRSTLRPWAQAWTGWVSAGYLRSWLDTVGRCPFVPEDDEQLSTLLDFYLVEKCLYELRYELNNRPDWIDIPLQGLVHILEV